MRCSKCGSENPDGAKFCDGCAAPLPLQCPSCGALNRASAKFCIECAAALGAVPAAVRSTGAAQPTRPEKRTIGLGAPLGPHEVPEGERKTVTALFADIKGSTELMRDLDPEEARAIVDPVLQLMMAAVHRYGGYVAAAIHLWLAWWLSSLNGNCWYQGGAIAKSPGVQTCGAIKL
jgi:hypothetical protein